MDCLRCGNKYCYCRGRTVEEQATSNDYTLIIRDKSDNRTQTKNNNICSKKIYSGTSVSHMAASGGISKTREIYALYSSCS